MEVLGSVLASDCVKRMEMGSKQYLRALSIVDQDTVRDAICLAVKTKDKK